MSASYLDTLNTAQRQAVETIDGPMLVIAGPGTGKTQLLSARVANILTVTDTMPQNILCLTFTESGANNMRERLSRFIGQDAYDVTISTYHAFGGELIRRYPEYFAKTRLENPVDELGKYQIVAAIVESMSYKNPLKQTRHHLRDLMSTISELKRGLLTAESLRAIATQNDDFISQASLAVQDTFQDFTIMPRKVDAALPYFEKTLDKLERIPEDPPIAGYATLRSIVVAELADAIQDAQSTNKTTPLTKWKNAWLEKDVKNKFILSGTISNSRLMSLADVLDAYQERLSAQGLYDFDDMILRAVQALEEHPDLKYTLQEQYQYILLDEFQDTNAAQFRLVTLLADNPVHEGKPNIMAVGDDDQAIYAFQGAHYSNMLDFYTAFRDVQLVPLTENYRSHSDVLYVAHNIAAQIGSRLQHQITSLNKVLTAANTKLPAAEIERHEFDSEIAEYSWIAHDIARRIQSGTHPREIAVLAPGHKHLEPLVSYLNHLQIPVAYEKREDVLETPTVQALIRMSQLVLALGAHDEHTANALWPEVMSAPFWDLSVSEIWRISWKVADSRGETTWTAELLASEHCKEIALFFLSLAQRSKQQPAETILDYLIGNEPMEVKDAETHLITSPMKSYYTNKNNAEKLYETLSHLTVIRARLREYEAMQDRTLTIADFLHFVHLYQDSETRMINTSPHHQHTDAVQLMTVFKAKGLEFEHVYIPRCHDDVWGDSSRGNSNRLTLPANLAPIRHIGASTDERLRIFFVAITRAKSGLFLTSHRNNYAGKTTKRLKYLDERSEDSEQFEAFVLPESSRTVQRPAHDHIAVETLAINWRTPHIQQDQDSLLKQLLNERLERYQLSPTHLNAFFDLVYAGPEAFFFNTILRFPSAPSASGQFGNAIHETLQWVQLTCNDGGALPTQKAINDYFTHRMKAKHLATDETERLIERGIEALHSFMKERGQMFHRGNVAEHSFRNEGVFVGDAHLSGTIDLMEIDREAKTITVVDYKTGTPHNKWASDLKLHKYRYQLYCYKILIEQSHTYKGYTVVNGRLEFVEPDHDGTIHSLELHYKDSEMQHIRGLIEAMWKRVKALDLPDVSEYNTTHADSKKFEKDLLDT